MTQLPPQDTKKWSVAHNSDLFGSIIRTKNIDFDNEGYITLARKAMALYSTDSDANFGARVVSIVGNSTLIYIITSDHVFSLTPTQSALTFAEITASSMPSIQIGSDAVMFADALCVSGDTTVISYAPSSWTSRITGLTSCLHPLTVFENRIELAVGDSNTVKTYNTSFSLQNTLTLPTRFLVTSLRWLGNNLYIGTRTTDGSEAMMFVWNGTGTAAQQGYPVGADWVYSMEPFRSSIVILTSNGQLKRFNGGGFDELPGGNFPVYYEKYQWNQSSYSATGVGHCLNRGMKAIGGRLYVNIDNPSTAGMVQVNQPEGLWVYDPNVGLYHKAGFVSEKFITLTISTLSSSIFTMASAHGVETGDAVWASSVTNIAALTAGQIYYAVKVSATALQLALSASDAYADRTITASGTLSGDTLTFDVLSMTGSTSGNACGAVYPLGSNGYVNNFFGYDVLFGGGTSDPDGNTISSVMSLGMGRNVGSFVTAWLPLRGWTDTFQKILAKMSELNLGTDKVVIKYRTKKKFGLPTPTRYQSGGKAIWVDTTSFSIDQTKKDVGSVAEGDEVEIVEGAASGYSAHITAINTNSNPYVYTVDETIVGGITGDLSEVYIDNWTRLTDTYISNATENVDAGFFEQSMLGVSASDIQFKFELRGYNVSSNLLDFIQTPHKKAE